MKNMMALVAAIGLATAPAFAQDGGPRCECKEFGRPHSARDHSAPPKPGDNRPEGRPAPGKGDARPEGVRPPPPGKGDARPEGARPPAPEKGEGAKCPGKDYNGLCEDGKKKTKLPPEELARAIKEHLKINHPDGICHCTCVHPPIGAPGRKEAGPEGGRPPLPKPEGARPEGNCPGKNYDGAYEDARKKKEGKPEEVGRFVKEHFKAKHPEGVCHCECSHPAAPPAGKSEGGPRPPQYSPKGNNGVGNGQDPQPPGKPPVNDGPGTGPGHPGNKR